VRESGSGLVGVDVVAVDGSNVSANASREATLDYERLAREVIEDDGARRPTRRLQVL
jgi:hypothetical protein